MTRNTTCRSLVCAAALAAALASPMSRAHSPSAELSFLSMLPVAVSVAAPVAVLSAGAMLTVVAVEATSAGTVWVLERASDGARMSLTLGGAMVAGVSVAAGTTVIVLAGSTGWVLSAAGKAIAYIPNEIGRALLHHERITR